jgi:hypothetical protein
LASGAYKQSREYSPRLQGKQGNFAAPIKIFHRFFCICYASLGRLRIAGPIVLAQHKGNKRIGEALTTIRSALPIVVEIAY